MADIDDFASDLLEEAKRFLAIAEKAEEAKRLPYLHAALMIGFCALEANVNSIADGFALRDDLPIHALSILREQEVRLDRGEFYLDRTRYYRLEDRILFLHKSFGAKPFDNNALWRSNLNGAISLRNDLTHPKKVPEVTLPAVRNALSAIIETIDALCVAVFKKPYPPAMRGLMSIMEF